MNIVLINHYAGSVYHGMEFRPYYLAKEWVEQGFNVTIIAAEHSHLRNNNPSIKSSVTKENIDGVNYLWLKTLNYQGNGIGRVFNIFSFVFQLFRFKRHLINTLAPDIVIASSTYPLDIFAAKGIAKKAKAKLIFEVHDLWPLSPMEIGNISKYHPFIQLLQYAENRAYRDADAVVSMLPCAKQHMKEHGMASEKFSYVPNGIVISDWKEDKDLVFEHLNVMNDLKSNGYFIFGYAGGHAASNSLMTVLKAAKMLKKERVKFVFVGDGSEKKNLQLFQEEHQLNNIVFLNSIPKRNIPLLLEFFDCSLILAINSPLYKFGISPNKIFDYMMSKTPIIQAIEAGNDMISESGCGFSVASENPEELANAMSKMINLSQCERDKMGLAGYGYVTKNHDYKILAKKFSKLFSK